MIIQIVTAANALTPTAYTMNIPKGLPEKAEHDMIRKATLHIIDELGDFAAVGYEVVEVKIRPLEFVV